MNAAATPSPTPRRILENAGLAEFDASQLLCPKPPIRNCGGRWIWLSGQPGLPWRNSYAYFRRCFTAGGVVVIRVAADTRYELHLDGRLVDRGTAPAVAEYKTFDTHHLHLSPGLHVAALLVHHLGQPCATAQHSRPGLWVEIAPQTGAPVFSDSAWKTLAATSYQQGLPCMMSHFGFYEVSDQEKVPAGWNTTGFDDSTWGQATEIGRGADLPWFRLIPRDIPLLESRQISVETLIACGAYFAGAIPATERESTVAVEMAARGRQVIPSPRVLPLRLAEGHTSEFVVVDFGRIVTGHARLRFRGAGAGQRIDLGYDERLDARGLPDVRRNYVHAADRFYLRAGQTELTTFGGRGFRYLLIDVEAGAGGLELTGVAVDERTYPVACAGTFRCSDPALEYLYQAGLTTTRLCMLDTYVDCPGRERVMWMDMAVEALCSVYGFGVTDLWRRCLFLFAQNPAREGPLAGAIKGFAPCDSEPLLASYTFYYVSSLNDYHWHSGDRTASAALFPTALRQLELARQFTTPEGLINDCWPGWGTFLDWSAMDFGGVSSCNTAIFIRAHRALAHLARELGDPDLAAQLDARAGQLLAAYRAAFWSPAEGLFVDALYDGRASPVRSQLANVMAIWCGAVSGAAAQAVLDHILDERVLLPRTVCNYRLKPGFKPQTGGIVPIGTPGSGYLLVQVLFELGHTAKALAYLKANWLPIAQGSTFAEHFVADSEISYCHGWSAGPAAQLPAFILGVRPTAPGWREVEIRPQPGGLKWAEGTVPTPYGEIHVTWQMVNGTLQLDYSVPSAIRVARAAPA